MSLLSLPSCELLVSRKNTLRWHGPCFKPGGVGTGSQAVPRMDRMPTECDVSSRFVGASP